MDFFQDIWNIPKQPQLENYLSVWDQMNLLTYFGNSIFLTVFGTLLSVTSASMCAYVIAKYKFRFSKILYTMALVVMLIPSIGTLPAMYRFMINTGLFDTRGGLLLLYSGGFGFNFILLYGFFKSISWSYAEAAFVDGATDAQAFFSDYASSGSPRHNSSNYHTGNQCLERLFQPIYVFEQQIQNASCCGNL